MSTISVPLSRDHQDKLESLVRDGVGSSRADVMRKALEHLAEQEAVLSVLKANTEPTLRGDVRALAKKMRSV